MNKHTFFLSHTWKYDEQNRNTHTRVMNIKTELEKLGHNTWFDDDKIIHDIDGSMAHGIDSSTDIIIFITKKYNSKVNKGSRDPRVIDNCYKECVYAVNSGKTCIPVIFENCMLDIQTWHNGVLKFYFGNKLYIDGTSDNYEIIAKNILKFSERTSQRLNDLLSPSFDHENKSIKNLNISKSPIKLINYKLSDRLPSIIQSNRIVKPYRSALILPNKIVQSYRSAPILPNKIVQSYRTPPILPNKIVHDKSCQVNIINKNWLNIFLKLLKKSNKNQIKIK